jgi:hypothetical protein
MTKITPEEFTRAPLIRPARDKKKIEKHKTQTFWGLCVPLGFIGALGVSIFSGSGGAFFPAWVVFSVIIWGVVDSSNKESSE